MSMYRFVSIGLIASILSLAPLTAFAAEAKKGEKKAEKDEGEKKDAKKGSKKKVAKKKKKKKKLEADGKEKATVEEAPSSTDFSFVNFLPFGIGQFAQGKTLIGTTFAASEAFMIFLYLDRQKQIALSNSDAQKTIDEVNASGLDPDEATIDYLAKNEEYVKKTQQEANLALVGFFGLYAIGVAEAVFDPFGLKDNPEVKAAWQEESDSERVARLREAKSPKLGMILLPDGNKGTYGFTLSKRFD